MTYDMTDLQADGAQDTEKMTPPELTSRSGEPRTAAGRALLMHCVDGDPGSDDWWSAKIQKVEAEAAGSPEGLNSAPSLSQHGELREALERLVGPMEGPDGIGDEEQWWWNHPEWPDEEQLLGGTVGDYRKARAALTATPSEPTFEMSTSSSPMLGEPAPAPLDVESGPGPGCMHVGPIESMAPRDPEKYRCTKCYGSVWPLCECGDPLDSMVHGTGPHRHAYEADLTARAAATEPTCGHDSIAADCPICAVYGPDSGD